MKKPLLAKTIKQALTEKCSTFVLFVLCLFYKNRPLNYIAFLLHILDSFFAKNHFIQFFQWYIASPLLDKTRLLLYMKFLKSSFFRGFIQNSRIRFLSEQRFLGNLDKIFTPPFVYKISVNF